MSVFFGVVHLVLALPPAICIRCIFVTVFEWDDAKSVRNLRKHSVAFEEAATSFYDPLGVEAPDPMHSAREERWLRLAMSSAGRLLVTVFVERDERIRIISTRPANAREARQYEG